MGWFKRNKEGITTSTREKKETPEGLWYKCPRCKTVVTTEDHHANMYVCDRCSYHDRIGSEEYFQLLFDAGKYTEFDKQITSADPLKFEDTKKYSERIKATIKKSVISVIKGEGMGEDFCTRFDEQGRNPSHHLLSAL